MNALRSTLRATGAGRLLYLLWHKPCAEVVRSRREGGPWQQWLTARGRAAMRAAAPHLPPIQVPKRQPNQPQLTVLTGRTLWYQTAFCLHSFFRCSEARPAVRILSDGTLAPREARLLATLFPGATLSPEREILDVVEHRLPHARFPALRDAERKLVLMRKLTHVHGAGDGWSLFFDSDMLFHRQPRAIEQWLAAPSDPVFMTDLHNAYGYPLDVLRAAANADVPSRINTGVSGLHAETINWAQLEDRISSLIRTHGTSYYMEQALFALHLAGREFVRLPADEYIVAPTEEQITRADAALHHYVDLSKRGYFRHAWRHVWHP